MRPAEVLAAPMRNRAAPAAPMLIYAGGETPAAPVRNRGVEPRLAGVG